MFDFFQSVRRDGQEAPSFLKDLDDVNIRNDDGENPLHVAITYSNIDAACELIRRGINVTLRTTGGQRHCIMRGLIIVRWLLREYSTTVAISNLLTNMVVRHFGPPCLTQEANMKL